MRGLAFRRFQEAKKKLFANKVWKQRWRWMDDREPDPASIGVIAHSPRNCSCHMCGNPRRWYGQKPIQELRAELNDD